ncbi:MAG: MFS transporter [Actinomycetes bacterium]
MVRRYEGRYGLAVGVALLGLCPNIVLSTAALPVSAVVGKALGAGRLELQLAEGMSNAGYAFGAVLAAQLAQRYVQRRLFLGYEMLFVVGSVLAAAAPNAETFFAGRVLQGAATGFMLISALPPLVTRFGVGRLPVTVAIVNVGLFGATTVGPLVGGVVAASGSWRLLFALAAGVGAVGWAVAWLGYVRFEPPDPDLPVDVPAITLALVATLLTFAGTSVLVRASLSSPAFLMPFVLGVATLAVLVVVEYRRRVPLMPVRALSTQLPVTGTVVAMLAGAVFVTVLELLQTSLQEVGGHGPLAVGVVFWPMPFGLLMAAVTFGAVFPTRYVPVLVNAGLLCLVAAAVVLLVGGSAEPGVGVSTAAFLLGFGAGATVSPGLFLAAMGVPSQLLGRAFALVELLRSAAAFAVGPVVLAVAGSRADPAIGVTVGLVVTLALAVVGLASSVLIPALSGARLRRPDLEAWLEDGEQALASPVTAVHVRPRVEDEDAAPLLPEPPRALRRRR